MTITALKIPDVLKIEHTVHADSRGFFLESFHQELFERSGIKVSFVQDNHSRSYKGVLRGLHFQKPPRAQDKLVRVISGKVLDVAVDIRKNSPTYGQSVSYILDAAKAESIFIPKGFAHGFLVLSDTADFVYKVSDYYSPQQDAGLLWNDANLGIDWLAPHKDIKVSEKDSKLPLLKDLQSGF